MQVCSAFERYIPLNTFVCRKIWNYPSDMRVSENCIDCRSEIVNGRKDGTQTSFPVSRRKNRAHIIYPKLPLLRFVMDV